MKQGAVRYATEGRSVLARGADNAREGARVKKPEQTVDTFAAGLGDRVLHCRELGHTWRSLTVSWDAGARAYDRRLRCSSCKTVRIQVLTERGHVVSNRYDYVDGYLAVGVEIGRGDRDTFRRVALERYLSRDAVEVA